MGLLKNSVPQPARREVARFVNEALPEGFIRNNFANGITVGGLALVVTGSMIDGKLGLALRAGGEVADDFDGDFARLLGIDDEFGALLDASLDKLKVAAEVWTLWKHTRDFEPEEQRKRRIALGIIAGKHATNMTLNVTAKFMGLDPHSSAAGQANLWVDGTALAAFGISDVTEDPVKKERTAQIGYAATAVGVITGGVAIAGYAGQFFTGHESAE